VSRLPNRSPQVVFTALHGGVVLLDAAQGIYFGLNSVGAEIWQLLPPECEDLDELCSRLSQKHPDVPPQTIRQDVEALLESLVTNQLASFPNGDRAE
jgi:hypothetical protein